MTPQFSSTHDDSLCSSKIARALIPALLLWTPYSLLSRLQLVMVSLLFFILDTMIFDLCQTPWKIMVSLFQVVVSHNIISCSDHHLQRRSQLTVVYCDEAKISIYAAFHCFDLVLAFKLLHTLALKPMQAQIMLPFSQKKL